MPEKLDKSLTVTLLVTGITVFISRFLIGILTNFNSNSIWLHALALHANSMLQNNIFICKM